MFIRSHFRSLVVLVIIIFFIVRVANYFLLRESMSGKLSFRATIPGTQFVIHYPITWYIVSESNVPENRIRIRPWLNNNINFVGVEINFEKNCTLGSEVCNPVKEIEKWQSSFINDDELTFGNIKRIDDDNSQIYYLDALRTDFRVVGLRFYVIEMDDKMFYMHTALERKYSGRGYIDIFNNITDNIARSLER